jgi:hypothetical protein
MGRQTGIRTSCPEGPLPATRLTEYPPTSLAQPNPVTGADMKQAAAYRLKTGVSGADVQIAGAVTAPCGARPGARAG